MLSAVKDIWKCYLCEINNRMLTDHIYFSI